MTPESGLGPCEQFTLLASQPAANPGACAVCDHRQEEHAQSGRRTLTGGEIEELRRRILIERFDQMGQDREQFRPPAGPGTSLNGGSEAH